MSVGHMILGQVSKLKTIIQEMVASTGTEGLHLENKE